MCVRELIGVLPRGQHSLVVLGKPDRAKLAPAELADDCVAAALEGVADEDVVISSGAVVIEIL